MDTITTVCVTDLVPGAQRQVESCDDYGLASIIYTLGRRFVACIAWNPGSGTIDYVEVDTDFRRRGVARALWQEALTHCAHLRHDTDSELSDEGHAWALAIGGQNAPVLPR